MAKGVATIVQAQGRVHEKRPPGIGVHTQTFVLSFHISVSRYRKQMTILRIGRLHYQIHDNNVLSDYNSILH